MPVSTSSSVQECSSSNNNDGEDSTRTIAGLRTELRLANVKNATMAFRIRVLERKMGISVENRQRILDVNMLMLRGDDNR